MVPRMAVNDQFVLERKGRVEELDRSFDVEVNRSETVSHVARRENF